MSRPRKRRSRLIQDGSFRHRFTGGIRTFTPRFSVDASTMNRVGQEDAMRFARGEEITTTHGLKARLSRPLDFLVVADHAEMYGLMPELLKGNPNALGTELGQRWYDMLKSGDSDRAFAAAMEIVASLSQKSAPIESEKIVRDARRYTALADEYNDPGRLTCLTRCR